MTPDSDGTSQFVLGCLHFGSSINQQLSKQLIVDAYSKGITSFDVGELYGNGLAQKILGNAIKPFRSQIKVWCSFGLSKTVTEEGRFGVTLRKLDSPEIKSSISKSLRSLQTDYIDVFNVHAPDDNTPYEETFEALKEVQEDGKIRSVSISNFNPDQLKKVMIAQSQTGLKIEFFQIHGNILEQSLIDQFIETIHKLGAKLYCYRPLARGLLARNYSMGSQRPTGSRAEVSTRLDKYFSVDTFEIIHKIKEVASAHNISSAQLAIYWLLKIRKLDGLIIGVKDSSQLDECLLAGNLPTNPCLSDELTIFLSDPEVRKIVNSFPDTYFET